MKRILKGTFLIIVIDLKNNLYNNKILLVRIYKKYLMGLVLFLDHHFDIKQYVDQVQGEPNASG
ncbi:MAG: hypothetical protein D3923_18290 [Candidatus Electrothrix sp. AR3]|nr:hypothetical protein [Candidatus Electrothrix sp. AR3]